MIINPSDIIARVEHRIRRQLVPGPLVLCFHSVRPDGHANDHVGAITRTRFLEMLEVIRRLARVVPLHELIECHDSFGARERLIALTFDDGYRDNLDTVLPMLERFDLPATFFITTSMLDQRHEFVWDELQQLIDDAVSIPDTIALEVGGTSYAWRSATGHEADPTAECTVYSSRDELYASLLGFLLRCRYEVQRELIARLATILGVTPVVRPSCRTLSADEVRRAAHHPLITVGSHTVSHAELTLLTREQRILELRESRHVLQEVIDGPITSLAYPYGGFDSLSNEIARECGYSSTFTIEPRSARPADYPFLVPRLMVRDRDAEDFEATLTWMFGT